MEHKYGTGLKVHSRWMRSIFWWSASSRNAVEVNRTSCCSSAQNRSWNTTVLKPSGHSPMPLPAHLQKIWGQTTSLLRSERTHTKTKRHIGAEAPFSAQVWWSNLAKTSQKSRKKPAFWCYLACFYYLSPECTFLTPCDVNTLSWKFASSGSLVIAFFN